LYASGDLDKDGKADILSVDSGGYLYFYAGRGNGAFQLRENVGYGWRGYLLAAGADLNGDKMADVVSRDSTGNLYFYKSTGGGKFALKTLIGTAF